MRSNKKLAAIRGLEASLMKHDESEDEGDGNKNLSDREKNLADLLDRKKNPLPENISEYVQKARDELKQYEEQKEYFEKRRKREIVLELIDLLEQYAYPKEWLRLIIAQELGDYISTSYIEKILAEKYPDKEKKKVKEQSTRQLTEIPQNDDMIPIEVSTTGESLVYDDNDEPGSTEPYDKHQLSQGCVPGEVPTGFKTDLERQTEEGRREIFRTLQKQVNDLQTKCYQLDQLVKEGLVWKEKYNQLHQEFSPYRNKVIKGTAQIEFGSEFLPVKIEYSFNTNQFSARIPEEVIDRILGAVRR